MQVQKASNFVDITVCATFDSLRVLNYVLLKDNAASRPTAPTGHY